MTSVPIDSGDPMLNKMSPTAAITSGSHRANTDSAADCRSGDPASTVCTMRGIRCAGPFSSCRTTALTLAEE